MKRTPTQIRHDYKAVLEPAGSNRSLRLPWRALLLLASIAAVVGLLLVSFGDAASKQPQPSVAVTVAKPLHPPVSPNKQHDTRIIQLPPAQAVPIASASAAAATPGAMPVPPAATQPAIMTTDVAENASIETLPLPGTTAALEDGALGRTRLTVALPPPAFVSPADAASAGDDAETLELVIASGDTLDGLFGKHGLSRADLVRILKLDAAGRHLQLLKPGDRIGLRHKQGQLLALDRALDEERTLRITRDGDSFAGVIFSNPVERRTAHGHGTIESSLFRAAQRAGISDTLIMELAGVFAWDIDFVLDIRSGDRFTVLYEEIWQDGEKLRDGAILAAEFINAGTTFRAVRFVDPDGNVGYFTADGHNVKKAFLRAPIAITPRVTSNFNPRRLHPVHKKVRPHRGVDYGAPSGTPIKAAGDGKVIFRGRKGSYGNAVILQHGGNITTLYAHMSRFHKRSGVGRRVRQGEVIGYVGATGTVTAAHLHYEYRVGGVHRNPRTVKLPKAQPVAAQHREAFAAATRPLLERLDLIDRSIRLAESSTTANN